MNDYLQLWLIVNTMLLVCSCATAGLVMATSGASLNSKATHERLHEG